ncbi:PREDICTED: uncharacterized protein LOC104706150 isoform X3 [Camelina sativa]|uniref:Uncharacterized protein LOC104706150 isoform X3 n=1 Tax=Camelina sativa TaxID=90675 RepID=A0ABM0T435_CAMSA|nr:PREDICTED: uncharacterized protein LOC104706150 isoform X3 [Camelina sativa]
MQQGTTKCPHRRLEICSSLDMQIETSLSLVMTLRLPITEISWCNQLCCSSTIGSPRDPKGLDNFPLRFFMLLGSTNGWILPFSWGRLWLLVTDGPSQQKKKRVAALSRDVLSVLFAFACTGFWRFSYLWGNQFLVSKTLVLSSV